MTKLISQKILIMIMADTGSWCYSNSNSYIIEETTNCIYLMIITVFNGFMTMALQNGFIYIYTFTNVRKTVWIIAMVVSQSTQYVHCNHTEQVHFLKILHSCSLKLQGHNNYSLLKLTSPPPWWWWWCIISYT